MAGMAAIIRILGVVTLAVAEWNSDRQRMNERPLVVNGIKQSTLQQKESLDAQTVQALPKVH